MNIYEKLLNIQNELKAPKNQFNKFGNYKLFRTLGEGAFAKVKRN